MAVKMKIGKRELEDDDMLSENETVKFKTSEMVLF